jgi:hypothetical protein
MDVPAMVVTPYTGRDTVLFGADGWMVIGG